jgi:TrmH family RNA methyltransferase
MQVGDFPVSRRLVFLESIRDPSNLGAIIRSAAAFGVDALVLSEDCADIYNAKTVRASMGTLFTQPILRVRDMREAVLTARQAGRRVFAAALDRDALQLGAFDVQMGDCVVIGNEGHGLSPETVAACDAAVFIPMTARAESLNAAVAASILMWTFRPNEGNTQMQGREIL